MGLPWETARPDVHQGLQQMMDILKKAPTAEKLNEVLPSITDLLTNLPKQ